MNWVSRATKALVYGLTGAMCGALVGWLFIVLWTAAFSGVPLDHAWRYIQDDRGRSLFGLGLVAIGLLVGLVGGAVKGLRGK
ncbi:MAG: hypothetical protein AMJ81_10450 [Phycisphaerae bacterium SM23_33]|nr:MAG: hypothetical protein AMJ81_10450 [Phycisphaerae bacterium SM23_33]